jgi:hypothetical protein
MQTREASASPVATLRYDCLPYDVLGAIGAYRRLASCDLATILADAPAPGRWFDFSDDEEKAYLNGVKWMLTPYGGDLEEPTAGGLRNKRAGGFLICGAEPGMRSRPLSGIRSTERALSALRYLEVVPARTDDVVLSQDGVVDLPGARGVPVPVPAFA